MKLGILGGLAAATALVGSMANAAPVSFDIDLFVTSSPDLPGLVNPTVAAGTATISYDDADATLNLFGIAGADPSDLAFAGFAGDLTMSITIFGETFGDADDPDASVLVNVPALGPPADYTPSEFTFAITSVADPSIISFATIDGILNPTTGSGDYGVNIEVAGVSTPSVIPLPAPFLLLGAGLAGLGLRNKLRKKA